MPDPKALQVTISLDDVKPRVWRRLLVPLDWDLEKLHLAIQAAFNWCNSHLSQFEIDDVVYGDRALLDDDGFEDEGEEGIVEYIGFPVANLLEKGPFYYRYDFGDDWQHSVTIDKLVTLDAPPEHAVCVAGAQARPPEDVGGALGYEAFLEVMADPKHEDYAHLKRWSGGNFDPKWFDIDRINLDLSHALEPDVKRPRHQPRRKV
ncbi:hypothetical protein ASD83_17155 [Devosia sp. Root685]|uniref:plasmid pRiA4b ORF-3 family protein n=1 Tax=Devosia sp. Root685 TaxID=1736587 RepID=UPI0006FE530E|nr:plasmid pRiA4b ORF-3 family protein [Devosia sp. Root685]KRA96798.1 hypothetical protein ASD83_17155 [Devosia sp. Root685]